MTEPDLTQPEEDPQEVAILLFRAMILPDGEVFKEFNVTKYTATDYTRMACHILFRCQRCGACCTTGDPIRLRPEDAAQLAKQLKIPLNRALKKYTIPDPKKPGVLDFKHILPCKFYDRKAGGCKVYAARPWSCRIFPFLGVYGSSDQVVVNPSCPGSVETMEILTRAMEEVRAEQEGYSPSLEEIRRSKEHLKRVLDDL
ncbi:MAG: YkgJ family cysteine cluster protein [Methanothrix sp.]|jgi:hypothetical protein|uniref:YkgJ family cysteine cluster protein n=1 Tax=Methanothrix sp. TaxID=90426 RepID=UPI0025F59575|nr:YkgJ family cysteine cluster protein [Methanothrix sp.]MCK9406251.1 YkgJ family cysteine cluster protein [Methanothrix sp.]MCK9567288.1 YkgJ family cysteine cluster protein [Methanothrix sp.]